MSVPEEIRKVKRPKSTVVVASGSGYRVRERIGCKNVNGRRVPIEGRCIGSIIDGKFVLDDPVPRTGSTGRVDIKGYGREGLCDMLNRDILDMLHPFYNKAESVQIYCMAMLKACYPGVRDYMMKNCYLESFLSEMYPGVPLGKNDVCKEQRNLGMEYSRIRAFMRARVGSMQGNDTLIIDGCLKQNHSRVDTFSQVSRKTKARKHKDEMMMYAYSENLREPVCSKIYPGNMVDSRAVSDFLKTNSITKGLIIADKGFTPNAVADAIGDLEDLHYLVPLKRDQGIIDEYGMYDFKDSFVLEERVECKKVLAGHRYLYSFRRLDIAKEEEEKYIRDRPDGLDPAALDLARKEFGTIVFECDMDIVPSKVYSLYQDRWLIELMFKFYQSVLDLDDTRVHDDFSDIGSDFIDFLATLMASRMLNRLYEIDEMSTWTFRMSLDFLNRLKMVRVDDGDEWEHRRLPIVDAELFEKMGLLKRPTVPVEVKFRGRPKGRKDSAPRKRRSDKGQPRALEG